MGYIEEHPNLSLNSLDIHSEEEMSELWPGHRKLIQTPMSAAENGSAGAARAVAAILFRDPCLRERHPKGLLQGGRGSLAGLLARMVRGAAARNIIRTFEDPPGMRVFEHYVKHAPLQKSFPSGILPGAQREFIRWLFVHGRPEQKFSVFEIYWFLLIVASSVSQMISLSYLLQPEWQTRFPNALQNKGADQFLEFLDRNFGPIADPVPRSAFPVEIPLLRDFSLAGTTLSKVAPFRWRSKGRIQRLLSQASADRACGVNLLGSFCYSAGVGYAARHTYSALRAVKCQCSLRDIPSWDTNIPRPEYLGLEYFEKTIVQNRPDWSLKQIFETVGWPFRADIYRIGIWFWELETIPTHWLDNLEGLNEVWAPTRFIAEAASRAVNLPVIEMLPPVPVPTPSNHTRRSLGLPEDRFLFLFAFDMASTIERKNPFAVIEAYKRIANKHTALVIKVSRGSFNPDGMARLLKASGDCGALVLDEVMPLDQLTGLFSCCDCYISLHRSEGLGLTMAEAMMLGKPVIATRYSGNLDFMNDSNSLLVDAPRAEVGEGIENYRAGNFWVEPSVEHAASHMKWVMENREQASALGVVAKRETTQLFDLKTAGRRMHNALGRSL